MAKRFSSGLSVEASTSTSSVSIAGDSIAASSSTKNNLQIHTADIASALTFAKSNTAKNNLLIEIFAQVLNCKRGEIRGQRLILLRNGNSGPALQSVYYEIAHPMPNIEIGDTVRCIGNFIGETLRFRVEKLTIVDDPVQHQPFVDRLLAISNHTMKK